MVTPNLRRAFNETWRGSGIPIRSALLTTCIIVLAYLLAQGWVKLKQEWVSVALWGLAFAGLSHFIRRWMEIARDAEEDEIAPSVRAAQMNASSTEASAYSLGCLRGMLKDPRGDISYRDVERHVLIYIARHKTMTDGDRQWASDTAKEFFQLLLGSGAIQPFHRDPNITYYRLDRRRSRIMVKIAEDQGYLIGVDA